MEIHALNGEDIIDKFNLWKIKDFISKIEIILMRNEHNQKLLMNRHIVIILKNL